ncbi:Uncharacterised protein [uncultured archaeon]|nr:Uncharacterised protein [uncultured archaeon]
MIPRALPKVGGPLGFGAKRMTTPPSAPTRSGRPLDGSLCSESSAISSGAIVSRRFSHSSGLIAATWARTALISGPTSFALGRSSGCSPMSFPITAPEFGAALYFTAFCSAYFSMSSLISAILYFS